MMLALPRCCWFVIGDGDGRPTDCTPPLSGLRHKGTLFEHPPSPFPVPILCLVNCYIYSQTTAYTFQLNILLFTQIPNLSLKSHTFEIR